jgi:hypothetical protein
VREFGQGGLEVICSSLRHYLAEWVEAHAVTVKPEPLAGPTTTLIVTFVTRIRPDAAARRLRGTRNASIGWRLTAVADGRHDKS